MIVEHSEYATDHDDSGFLSRYGSCVFSGSVVDRTVEQVGVVNTTRLTFILEGRAYDYRKLANSMMAAGSRLGASRRCS